MEQQDEVRAHVTPAATQDSRPSEKDALAQLASVCDQRAALYGLVCRLFISEVDDELIDEMRKTPFPARTGDASLDRGYELIVAYLSRHGQDAVHDLAIDYVRTFIGCENTAYSAAYPFESVYTSEKRLLMQEARDEVAALYKAAGMRVDPSWRDPEDHVGLELQYMQLMSERCAEAARAGREEEARSLLVAQRNFLEDHLVSWVPMMIEDLREKAGTDFYRGLSYVTEGLLKTDAEALASILS